MRFIVWILVAVLTGGCLFGCQIAPTGFPKEYGDAAQAITTSIASQAVWAEIAARLDGQIIEPGMEGYYRVEYAVGARLPGVSGQVALSGEGEGKGEIDDAFVDALVLKYGEDRPFWINVIRELGLTFKKDPAPGPVSDPVPE